MPKPSPEKQREQVLDFVEVLLDRSTDTRVAEGITIKWTGSSKENTLEVRFPKSASLYTLLKDKPSFRVGKGERLYKDSTADNYIGTCIAILKTLEGVKDYKTPTGSGKKSFTLHFPSKEKEAILTYIRPKLESLLQQETPLETTAKKLRKIPSNLPPSGAYNWFVGRSKLLEEIHQFFHTKAEERRLLPRLALQGMLGVGKSEIARQYAQKYAETYKGGMVFIDARGDEEREDGAYFDDMLHIAQQLVTFIVTSVDESLADQASVMAPFEFLRRFWTQWANSPEPVLIILDDLVNYENKDHTLDEVLPPQLLDRFKILITTRKRFTPSLHYIDVNKLTQFDSYEMFSRILGEGDPRLKAESSTAYKIVDFLECLPLGIELTGRYLFSLPKLPLSTALADLEQRKLQAEELLKSKSGLALNLFQRWWRPRKEDERDRDMTSAWGVYAALQLSWELLKPNAQVLAYALSLYAHHPIPDMSALFRIFRENCSGDDEFHDIALAKPEFEKIKIRDFINGSLIKKRGLFLEVHQLVREFFIAKFNELAATTNGKELSFYIRKEFCSRMSLRLYEDNISSGSQEQERGDIYIAHVIEGIRVCKAYPDILSLIDRADRLLAVGNYYYEKGVYSSSLTYIEEAASTAIQSLISKRENHKAEIHLVNTSFEFSKDRLTLMYLHLPEHQKQVKKILLLVDRFFGLYQQQIKERKILRLLSCERNACNEREKRFFFASFIDTLGDPPEIVEAIQKFRTEKNRETGRIDLLNFLVSTQEDPEVQIALFEIRLIAESRKETVPHNHPKYLSTLLKLADQLMKLQVDYQEGLQAHEEALTAIKIAYPNKPHLIESLLDQLAHMTLGLGLYEKAEIYYKQLLSELGDKTLVERVNLRLKLAEAYAGQDLYSVAVDTVLEDFDSTVLLLTKESPHELGTLYKALADYCLLAGRLEELDHYSKQQLSANSRKALHNDISYFIQKRLTYVREQIHLGQWKQDLQEFYKLLLNTHNESENLYDIVHSINNDRYLARVFEYDERFPHLTEVKSSGHSDLIALITNVLNERRKSKEENLARYASTAYKAAQIFSACGQLEEALSFYEEAFSFIVHSYDGNHELVALTRKNIAEISFKLKDYSKAILHLQPLIRVQAAFLNSDVWNVHKSQIMLAQCLLGLNREEEAIYPLKVALVIAIDRRGGHTEEANEPLKLLVSILYQSNRIDEASSLVEELEIGNITDPLSAESDRDTIKYRTYVMLSQKLEQDKRNKEAISFIDQALECGRLSRGDNDEDPKTLRKRKSKLLKQL
jgi:hypothetical protein